jgi:hypothetical protein
MILCLKPGPGGETTPQFFLAKGEEDLRALLLTIGGFIRDFHRCGCEEKEREKKWCIANLDALSIFSLFLTFIWCGGFMPSPASQADARVLFPIVCSLPMTTVWEA